MTSLALAMPDSLPDSGDHSLVSFNPVQETSSYPIHHGLRPPLFRIRVSWVRGSTLHIACLRQTQKEASDDLVDRDIGGKVIEVTVGGAGGEEVDEAQRRRISYLSAPAFSLLQGERNSLSLYTRTVPSSHRAQWWQHVLEYSKKIGDLLGKECLLPISVIEDPKMILHPVEEPTSLKAAWQLIEIFYVDKQLLGWLPERLVDWLAEYDCLISCAEETIHANLVYLQKKFVNLQVVEDDPEYWRGLSLGLAVGWLDIVVKLLRLHGSYQLDQLHNREIENGLVEAVVVLISTMPRLRPDLRTGKLGQCYKTKPDFMQAWEKWRVKVAKLESSAYWIQCGHRQTREGLKNLLQIMLGKVSNLVAATCHWLELYISHFLFTRPFTVGLEEMCSLAQKCMQLKPSSNYSTLVGLFTRILGDNTEVILAECLKAFGPWMVVHAIELLTAENNGADILLHEERHNWGGISMEELHRLVYALALSSHPLTWQIAPTYLSSCSKQGWGLFEILMYKQPVQHYTVVLKNLEICRLYELENISSNIMKAAGIYNWKHGRKGPGIYWLQQAKDELRLNKIAQQLYDYVGKSISDDGFKHWEGLIELLGSEVGSSGGLDFLHRYRDFRKSLQLMQDGNNTESARQTIEFLLQLMKYPSTPQRFWLPLLLDSVKLLNWRNKPLLNVSETKLLLNKLQIFSMARVLPDFPRDEVASQVTDSVKLALATNLGRAILEES